MKKFTKLFLLLLCLAALGLSISFFLLNKSVTNNNNEILYTVENGATFNTVTNDLYTKGLIRSPLFLKIFGRITGKQKEIKSGSFIINTNMSSTAILTALISGQEVMYKITIPEGFSLSKIADILQLERITNKNDFIAAAHNSDLLHKLDIPGESAEGYLYPDTYMFPREYPAEKVISHMVENLHQQLGIIYPSYKKLSSKELYNTIIMASIVEREYRIADEAPLMASAFYNRLDIDHRLESCATIVYVLTEKLGKDNPDGAITFADTQIVSPYNTYKKSGLPPGPISNPGEVAIRAAFFPAQTDYMFFRVVDPAIGKHQFSKTYEEHLNVYQYSIKAY